MDFKEKEYKIFEIFNKNWALVTAGDIDKFNTCTVSWGSMGTLWTRPDKKDGAIVSVYIHPARYTLEFLKENDYFTVSFFDDKYKKSLAYLGSHSGKDGDKVTKSELTPIQIDDSVTFKEANTTFVCKKLYLAQLSKDGIAQEIKDYYAANPKAYPVDENGEWQPHYLIMGDIVEVK